MDRRTVQVAVVAVVCIVALAAAAATLDSTQDPGGGSGFSSSEQQGIDDDEGDSFVSSDEQGELKPPSGSVINDCSRNSFWRSKGFVIGMLIVFAGGAAFVGWRANKLVAFALLASVGTPMVLLYSVLAACPGGEESNEKLGIAENTSINMSAPQGGGAPGAGDSVSTVPPPMLLMVLLGLVLLVAAVVLVRNTDDDVVEPDDPVPEEEDFDEAAAVEAIGRVAGETADRIDEDGKVENEVYEAWREMVGHLQVPDPETTTPGEFAAAAEQAGMGTDDVRELTDLFESVRYGGFDATADRERRAVEALRRIEEEYAEDDE